MKVDDDDAAEDPPIIPLDDDELPEVSSDVLPEWARSFVSEVCDAKEVSPTVGVMLVLPVIASCVQRRYKVQIEASHTEPLCIYAAPALESGERKTAVHGPLGNPLFEYQKQLSDEAQAEQQTEKVRRKLIEQKIKVLEKQHLEASDDEQDAIENQIIDQTKEMPRERSTPQVIIEDFTEVALAANGESLLVTSDEGGLFDNLAGRHKDVPEIDLFLKAHTGASYTYNCIVRGNILLQRPLVLVGISPQPVVLAKLAKKEGFLTRGLTARFLWALPKSSVGLRWVKPWVSKLPAAVARIAAVCHCGDYLDDTEYKQISEDQMKWAVNVGRSLIPHAVAAHRLMGGGGYSTVQAVVEHYNTEGWPTGEPSLTEWWRPVRRIVGETSREFEPLAQTLADHGYLIPVQPQGRGGWGMHYRANSELVRKSESPSDVIRNTPS